VNFAVKGLCFLNGKLNRYGDLFDKLPRYKAFPWLLNAFA